MSQPTVYRHFPDRATLLKGLAGRVDELMGTSIPTEATLDDVGSRVEAVFEEFELYREAVHAETLVNADPRSFGELTSRTSRDLVKVVAAAFPDDDRRRVAIAGLLRCLGLRNPGSGCVRSSAFPAPSPDHYSGGRSRRWSESSVRAGIPLERPAGRGTVAMTGRVLTFEAPAAGRWELETTHHGLRPLSPFLRESLPARIRDRH